MVGWLVSWMDGWLSNIGHTLQSNARPKMAIGLCMNDWTPSCLRVSWCLLPCLAVGDADWNGHLFVLSHTHNQGMHMLSPTNLPYSITNDQFCSSTWFNWLISTRLDLFGLIVCQSKVSTTKSTSLLCHTGSRPLCQWMIVIDLFSASLSAVLNHNTTTITNNNTNIHRRWRIVPPT